MVSKRVFDTAVDGMTRFMCLTPWHLALADCHLSSGLLDRFSLSLNLFCSFWTNKCTVQLRSLEVCSMTPAEADERICPACKGSGRSLLRKPAQMGHRPHPIPCDQCAGKGRVSGESEKPSERGTPLLFG
jgi:hypothetical protein